MTSKTLQLTFFSRAIFFATGALAVHGFIESFIPTPLVQRIAIIASALAGLIAFAMITMVSEQGKAGRVDATKKLPPLALKLLWPTLFAASTFLCTGHSLPAIYTRATGQAIHEAHNASATSESTPKSFKCAYRLEGGFFTSAVPSHFCVTKNFYESKKEKSTFIFSVFKSKLGRLIISAK